MICSVTGSVSDETCGSTGAHCRSEIIQTHADITAYFGFKMTLKPLSDLAYRNHCKI
jgi:hypothetical protein